MYLIKFLFTLLVCSEWTSASHGLDLSEPKGEIWNKSGTSKTFISQTEFTDSRHIQILDLSVNNLTTLLKDLFKDLPFLKHIYLSKNPWNCDCSLLWLSHWLRVSDVITDDPMCETPPNLNGFPLLNLTQSSQLDSCNNSCLSKSGQQKVSRSLSSNGMELQYYGMLDECIYMTINLSGESSTHLIQNSGSQIIANNILLPIVDNSYLIADNSNLSFYIDYPNNPFSNCSGQVFTTARESQDSKEESVLNLTTCQMKPITINIKQNITLNYKIKRKDLDLTIRFNLTVVPINRDFILYLTPNATDTNCALIYERDINITFDLRYKGESSINRLFIDNTEKIISSSSLFSYTFDTVGKFELKISIKILNVELFWKAEVNVNKSIYFFTSEPKVDSPIASGSNVTFTLIKYGDCYVSNNVPIVWFVRESSITNGSESTIFNQQITNSNHKLIYTFPRVGTNNRLFSITSNKNQNRIFVNVFDQISDFKVTADPRIFCTDRDVPFFLSQSSGSNVTYRYQTSPNDEWINVVYSVGSNINISFPMDIIYNITFIAKNDISEERNVLSVRIVKDLYVELDVLYKEVDKNVIIKPQVFLACQAYEYQWMLGGIGNNDGNGNSGKDNSSNGNSYQQANPYSVPSISTLESNETKTKMQLKVKLDKNPIVFNSFVYFEYPITIVELGVINDKNNIYIGEYIQLTSQITTLSTIYYYRWVVDAVKRPWNIAGNSFKPTLNISFSTEAYHEIMIEVKNNVTNKNSAANVFVQYPVAVESIFPAYVIAEVAKEFEIVLNLRKSKFPYFIQVSDDEALIKDIKIQQSIYKFIHIYKSDGLYNITFNISDKINSSYYFVPVKVLYPVAISNVVVDDSIAMKDDIYYLKHGDFLNGHAAYSGTGNVTLSWHLLSKTETTLISDGYNISHQFDKKGTFTLKVLIGNEINTDEKSIAIVVEKQQTFDLQLLYSIGKQNKSSDVLPVATKTTVLFTLLCPKKSNTILSYVWLLEGVRQEKAKKKRFSYTFSLQGQFSIQVKATTLFETKSITMDVEVQNRLVKGYLIALCGNTTLNHQASIPSNCNTIKLNHVYFEPTDTKFVSGTLSCYQNHFNPYFRQILYQAPYKKSLPDANISVRYLIGYIHCEVSLRNNISQVTSTYSFLKFISPTIEFFNPTRSVKRGSTIMYHVTLYNVSVNSTVEWYVGGSQIPECISNVYRTLQISASCKISFTASGQQSIFVVLRNDIKPSFSETLKVGSYGDIDVYLSPTFVEALKKTRIQVKSNNSNQNNYYWPEYNSNLTHISFLARKAGFKDVTVVASNQIATKTVKTTITIYPVFYQVQIKTQGVNVQTKSIVALSSTLTFPKLVYKWFINSIQLSYSQHTSVVTESFKLPGSYNITLIATSPFRSVNSTIFLQVIDPIKDLNISYVPTKQDKHNAAVLAADNLLIGDKNYTFNVTWNNGNVDGELDFLRISNVSKYQSSCTKYFCLFNFVTLPVKSNVDVEVEIKNNVSSNSTEWHYDVFPLLRTLNPIVSRSNVPMNVDMKFWIDNIYEDEVEYSWDIGDDSIHLEGPSVTINTSELSRIGRHMINVTATGLFVFNGKRTKTFFITTFDEECEEPSFTKSDFRNRALIKSKWFYAKISLFSTCKLTFSWYFEKAGKRANCEAFAQRQVYVSPLMQLNMKKEALEIPPRYFRTGYYCVRSNITYGTYGIVSKGFLLHVKNSPLIPVLSGGKVRTVGFKQKIFLKASDTIDPDASYNLRSALFYQWQIIKMCCDGDTKVVNVTVPYNSQNAVALMNGIVPFEANSTYKVQVSIKRSMEDDDEEAFTTAQEIKIINGTSLLVEIVCISCRTYKATKYIRNENLKLIARCSNCEGLDLQYSWSVIGQKTGDRVELDENSVATPRNSKLIVVNSEVLDGKQPYTFKLDVFSEELDSSGSTSLTIENNISPKNGSCIIDPMVGYTLVTKFQVHCAGWSDNDNQEQPFIYWLTYGDLGQNVVFRGAEDFFKVYLPKGNVTDDYMVKVNVLVEDSLGAYTVAFQGKVQVMVSSFALSDPTGFITKTVFPLLDKGVTVGDINQVGAAVLASCLLFENGGGDRGKVKGENDTLALNGLIRGSYSIKPVSIDTIDQVINAQQQVFTKSGLTGITSDNRFEVLQSLKTMLILADTFSKESVSLPKNARNRLMWLIGNTIEFYGRKLKVQSSSGINRRSADIVQLKDYNILDNLYKIVMSTTISGEKEVRLTGNLIETHLAKDVGTRLLGSKTVAKCKISLVNISSISKLPSSSVQIVECSGVNYYDPPMADVYPLMTSITLKDDTFNEVEVKDLKGDEKVLITLPTAYKANDSVLNIYQVKSKDLVVLELPQLNETADWRRTGVHVAFDVTLLTGGCSVIVYLSENETITVETITVERNTSKVYYIVKDSSERNRTIFLKGYNSTLTYYLGIEHTCSSVVEVRATMFTSSCVYWNRVLEVWDTSGCESSRDTTRDRTVCQCRHLSTFTSNVRLVPNTLDFTVLNKVNFRKNSVALVTVIVVVVVYLIILIFAYRRDKREFKEEHVIPIADSADRFFQYEVRFKTGMFPWAGTSAKVYMKLFGTACTTQPRPFTHEGNFQRNGLDTFIISVNKSIGKIYKIHVWHDNSGSNPSWFLERVVIRSLLNGEKFFFFCNKWLGLDSVDGTLDHEFYVADMREIKKFSTIFYDFIKRGMSDYHLWLSVFEKPKFSKFTRVQRVTCLVSFVFAWMAVNAMWFQVAPDGDIDIYFGFKGYSFEEIVIAIISVAMVVPLHVLIVLIFRKSRQTKMPQKPLKIWKSTAHSDYSRIDVPSYVLDPKKKKNSEKHEMNNAVESDDGEFSSLLLKKAKCFDLRELSDFGENDKSRSDLTTIPTKPLMQFLKPPRIPLLHLPRNMDAYITTDHRKFSPPDSNPEQFILPDIEPIPLLANICVDGVLLDSTEAFEPLIPFSPVLSDDAEGEDDGFDRKEDEVLPLDRLLLSSNERYAKKRRKKRYMTEKDLIVERNEKLAKEYGIPDIYEYDACTRWMLPFWCVYIGHLCCFVISAFSILVIITYAEQFGYEVAMKWLRVFFIGLAEDILLQYPFMVILAAAITALLIKPLDLDKIDHYDFVACPHSEIKPGKTTITKVALPLAGIDLEEAKKAAIQQRKYYSHMKKTIFLVTLLWCVLCITNIQFDSELYDPMARKFFKSFGNFSSHQDYTTWLRSIWNSYAYDIDKNTTWLITSTPSIRQLQNYHATCDGVKNDTITSCIPETFRRENYLGLSGSTETTTPAPSTNYSTLVTYIHWATQSVIVPSSIILGNATFYPLSGTARHYRVIQTFSNITTDLSDMTLHGWLNCRTCTLSHVFTFYQPALDKYAYVNFLFTQELTGHVTVSFDYRSFRIHFLEQNIDIFSLACIVLLILLTLCMLFYLIKKIRRKGMGISVQSFSFIHNLCIVLMSLATSIILIIRVISWRDFSSLLLDSGHIKDDVIISEYIVFDEVALQFCGVLSFLVITKVVYILKYFDLYKSAEVLARCFNTIVSMIFLHIIVVFIFTLYSITVFQSHLFSHRTVWSTFMSVLCRRWEKPTRDVTFKMASGHAAFIELLWSVYWLIIPINMFRAILIEGVRERREMVEKSHDLFTYFIKFFYQANKKNSKREKMEEDVTTTEERETVGTEVSQEVEEEIELPPLPVPLDDIDSRISELLGRLDRKTAEEVWEEERVVRIAHRLNTIIQ